MKILSLCDASGAWAKPYKDAGYDVQLVDLLNGYDVRLLEHIQGVHGILAAPPCTVFSNAGTRWKRTPAEVWQGLSVVDACLRIILMSRPQWWCLENPVGSLANFLGPPRMMFQPYEFGDPWTKRTCLWGDFHTGLPRTPVKPKGSLLEAVRDPDLRSVTPSGFAQAFFSANP